MNSTGADSVYREVLPLIFAFVTCVLTPAEPRQGDVVRVQCPDRAATVWLNGRKSIAFPQADGSRLALVPVPVLEKPGTYKLEVKDNGGSAVQTVNVRVQNAHFPTQNITVSRAVQTLRASPGEMETVRAFRNTVTPERRWEDQLVHPVPGCMTSPFGVQRLHNGKPTGNFHGGLDHRGPTGTPVKAVASGTVRLVREYNIHGNVVGIDHGQGLTSIYLHLSKFDTTEEAQVKQGDVIGEVGSTGRSNAPHLHWGLYAYGQSINPTQWLTVPPCEPVKAKPVKAKPAKVKKRSASGSGRVRGSQSPSKAR